MEQSKFSIKVSPIASEDLDSIYTYIANELFNENAANNVLSQIESSILRLKHFPFSGPVVNDEILKLKGYRKLVIDHYIVFYLVYELEKQVVIMRVLYGRRDFYDIL